MRRNAVISTTLAALAALSAALCLADVPLTLGEAQRLAVARSRQLVAQDASITASRELAVAAGQHADPVLKVELQNVPVEGMMRWSLSQDFMTMRSVGVMQEWTRKEKRDLRRERFEREADRGTTEKQAIAATIERDTALAWLDRYYAEAMVAVARDELAATQLEIVAADSAYRSGRVNQSDVLGAQSGRAAIEDRVSELERRARNAATVLARWTGTSPDVPLAGKPAIGKIAYEPSQLDAQVARHPTMAILERQQEIAATEARLASAETKADPSFELMYGNRASMFGDMITFGVSIPLQWNRRNRQDREVAAKLALAEAVRAEREENARSILLELSTMAAEWRNGLERLARYQREIIPLARERSRAALAAYQGAKASSGDLLLARRDEINARMQALQLEVDTARLWAALTYLAPGSVGGSGSMPSGSPGASRSMGSGSTSSGSMSPRSMGGSNPVAPAPPAPSSGSPATMPKM
jgi:outer membrane protein TolC